MHSIQNIMNNEFITIYAYQFEEMKEPKCLKSIALFLLLTFKCYNAFKLLIQFEIIH